LVKQVAVGEESVLDVFARQATGPGVPAGLASPSRPRGGAASQAVLEELLVLLPPVLSKQRLTYPGPRSVPRCHRLTTAL
jgi:hypothetical protein